MKACVEKARPRARVGCPIVRALAISSLANTSRSQRCARQRCDPGHTKHTCGTDGGVVGVHLHGDNMQLLLEHKVLTREIHEPLVNGAVVRHQHAGEGRWQEGRYEGAERDASGGRRGVVAGVL